MIKDCRFDQKDVFEPLFGRFLRELLSKELRATLSRSRLVAQLYLLLVDVSAELAAPRAADDESRVGRIGVSHPSVQQQRMQGLVAGGVRGQVLKQKELAWLHRGQCGEDED